ncbi:hypothetical protein FJV41_35340 [Myxococcus llanfairpwllgwyngyllgogerychwyrndrobwllllantysiliogogogochensis]|uniref:Uncharacterized protein n=1 Tax=Myxococcus llanfairpwllgwyngyllgogerychwyrndrobwllllantysiliogogogochensis TaxID=2590453 RepID=A0A540WS35_9BACT|nr:hypothetical protein [Myxococcus llanfairpwllgwyngyllgogerychwyrndrobwllllantysiliogogogochensis]TQF11214.1 hypothetical protein FJV41_35340 [Myxococcus llanfairpwllgwyngyllgogerychwyrndrobwllllantysiliogogogochensis]
MTAQISDQVLYRDQTFILTGVKGTELFVPGRHGLNPVAQSTACLRGFFCGYRVTEEGLFLQRLHVGVHPDDKPAVRDGHGTPLFGNAPRYDPTYDECAVYDPRHAPVPFTGSLLIATDFIRELAVHMGFAPAWKFREVHELTFEAGRLTSAQDHSKAMAHTREQRIVGRRLTPGASASREEIEAWIESTFRLDYE